ncbi:MAG TPA: PPK2 family polyphosphate kinase [Kiloniellales bacterium]|nr:PPK2 family polyphosphate kinase [Kiloniellales bacterium]
MDRRILEQAVRHCRVVPGRKLDLARHPADWLPVEPRGSAHKAELKDRGEELLEESRQRLAAAQEVLWASDSHAMLVILQGLDAAGKDGIIKHVVGCVNPMGVQVTSFRAPNAEELDHDFLWRAARRLPERGQIGVFNRSYYEEVLVVRVHPEFLAPQRLPIPAGPALWQSRYRSIRDFERHLGANGTVVRKFFLNVSKEEQSKQLIERIDDPTKFWKFNPGDAKERAHWQDYMAAFAEALPATSTQDAPWYVIPADRKWFARALVAHILTRTIEGLKLTLPQPSAKDRAAMAAARRLLAGR